MQKRSERRSAHARSPRRTAGLRQGRRRHFEGATKRILSRISPYQGICVQQQKSPTTRQPGASGITLSREERGPLRHGRVAWLTAVQPITVAGPRPIHTAFPATLACKLKFECKPRLHECQCRTGKDTAARAVENESRKCLAILPVGLALFHQCAQAFLRILEAVELVQENVHGMFESIAQR